MGYHRQRQSSYDRIDMNEAERKHISRQYNHNRVPHPLFEGLVFMSFGTSDPKKVRECIDTMIQKIEENEITKIIDAN